MSTPVSICSNALLKLGSRAISSLTPVQGSPDTVALCANIYPEVRDALLRAHLWNFAVKRKRLPAEQTAPIYGYTNSHPMPSDFLRLIEVEGVRDFTVESKRILCNTTPVNIAYIYRNEDVSTYDTLFVELLTQRMVAELAYAVTSSDSKAQSEMEKYKLLLKQARTVDAMEQPMPQFDTSSLITERF